MSRFALESINNTTKHSNTFFLSRNGDFEVQLIFNSEHIKKKKMSQSIWLLCIDIFSYLQKTYYLMVYIVFRDMKLSITPSPALITWLISASN